MIRIKWVDPKREGTLKGIEGEIRGKTIVLFKGRASDLTKAHERAHIILGHHKYKKITPEVYVRGEVDANLYTYRRIGRPRRLITELRGILWDLKDTWGVPLEDGLKIFSGEFGKRKDIPVGWRRDLERLSSEVYA